MNKKLQHLAFRITFCFLTFSTTDFYSQAPTIQWEKEYGSTATDYCRSVIETPDGGYVVVGDVYANDGDVTGYHNISSCPGCGDIWVIKVDAVGNLLWQRALGGTGPDFAEAVVLAHDGGYIVAGSSASADGDVTASYGSWDYWIVKLNTSGGIEWEKCYGGSTGLEQAHDIIPTSDGGYAISGEGSSYDGDVSNSIANGDFWIIKIDSIGNLEWEKSYGGGGREIANSIRQITNGGYIVAGYTSSTNGHVTENKGSADYWILKLDSTGELVWQKTFGGTKMDEANEIQQTNDGGYIIIGTTESNNGDVSGYQGSGRDIWVVKINSTGEIEWQKAIGSTVNDGGNSIIQTQDGGYLCGGKNGANDADATGNPYNSGFWAIKLENSGDIQWQKTYGTSGNIYSIKQTSDEGFIIAGDSPVNFRLVKLSPEEIMSIQDKETVKILIHPNPSNSFFTIADVPVGAMLSITDYTGKPVYNQLLMSEQTVVETSTFTNGIYFLNITHNGIRTVEKLIINK